jgi:hypothetical protein
MTTAFDSSLNWQSIGLFYGVWTCQSSRNPVSDRYNYNHFSGET